MSKRTGKTNHIQHILENWVSESREKQDITELSQFLQKKEQNNEQKDEQNTKSTSKRDD